MNHNLSVYQITGSRSGSQVQLTKLPKVAPAVGWTVIPPEAGQVEGEGRTLQDITGSQISLSGLHLLTGHQDRLAAVKYPTALLPTNTFLCIK